MEIKLAESLNRLMKSKNMSIRDIANRCDVPKSTISDWINGKVPSQKVLMQLLKISETLDVSLDELVFNHRDSSVKAEVVLSSSFKNDKSHFRITVEKMDEE